MLLHYLILLLWSCLLGLVHTQSMFTNPITDRISPDPSILHFGDSYYMVISEDERDMVVYKSDLLTDFRNATSANIHLSNSSYDACWAPELHLINEDIYCYFSMHKIGENDHRMWVSKAVNSSDPMGLWDAPIQLMQDEAQDANDGTVFQHPTNGKMYFVFTRLRPGIHNSALYIAPMSDPYTVDHPRILLRIPAEGTWECLDACLNEGAHMLIGLNNISHLIFSGSGSGSRNYALGRMSILPDVDPLLPSNWGPAKGPIFSENIAQNVYGPGHAAFTTSKDGTEIWFSYHAQNTSEPNNRQRIAYLDKVEWDMIGYPVFPIPHGENNPQKVPSGQE